MKLATIERIENVGRHPNADRLSLGTVLGFQCVTPKDAHSIGELVAFIQPDTSLPAIDSSYTWATEYHKYVGARVKAIQIRGEWSEGIIVPISQVRELLPTDLTTGMEISSFLGITKFVAPEPEAPGAISSILPMYMKETHEDRFENLAELPIGSQGDISLKIDGRSTTYYYDHINDKFGVCGRSIEFDVNYNNPYTQQAHKFKDAFIAFCKERGLSLALRGEVYGSGVSEGGNNPHNKKEKSFACFNVFNITDRKYETKGSELYFLNVCEKLGIETVPVLEKDVEITQELIDKYSKGVKRINLNGVDTKFEGVVVKYNGGSFKIINKHYDSEK